MGTYTDARGYEDRGEYRQAAAAFARLALDELIEANFEPTRKTRTAIGHLLQAISCDARAMNEHRAAQLQQIAEQLLTVVRDDTDELALEGLTYEWLGDGYLFLGSAAAHDAYEAASERYAELGETPQFGWGMEEEFDYAYWAFESFVESAGYSIPANSEIEFRERIQFKLTIVDELIAE